MIAPSSVVGIDVSKATLEVAIGLDEPVVSFPNAPKGHRALAKLLTKRAPSRIIFEATGGYERDLLRFLTDRQLPAIRVNSRQFRDFARATGVLAKTDAIDARVIVRFGSAVEPEHRPLPSPHEERLAMLQKRRVQLIAERTAESNRLELMPDPFIQRTIKKMITTLETLIKQIEAESAEVIAEHEAVYASTRSSPPSPAWAMSPPRCSWATCQSSVRSHASRSPPSPA